MKLWVRADGSPTIGLGHIMRTMAIAEVVTEAGVGTEYVSASDPTVTRILRRRQYEVHTLDSPKNITWLDRINDSDVILFDGYHFTANEYLLAGERAARVGAIDDFGVGHFPVDVLINAAPPTDTSYVTRSDTDLLLGPEYALVRSEFGKRRKRRGHRFDTLLITMGGTHTGRLTAVGAMALELMPPSGRVQIVVGPANPETQFPSGLEVIRDPPDMAAVFNQADAVISAAGNTAWELLAMGMPSGFLKTADNQAGVAEIIRRRGAGLTFLEGTHLEESLKRGLVAFADRSTRSKLSTDALALVDGKGANRVVEALLQ